MNISSRAFIALAATICACLVGATRPPPHEFFSAQQAVEDSNGFWTWASPGQIVASETGLHCPQQLDRFTLGRLSRRDETKDGGAVCGYYGDQSAAPKSDEIFLIQAPAPIALEDFVREEQADLQANTTLHRFETSTARIGRCEGVQILSEYTPWQTNLPETQVELIFNVPGGSLKLAAFLQSPPASDYRVVMTDLIQTSMLC